MGEQETQEAYSPELDGLGHPDGSATFDRFRSRVERGDDAGALADGEWCWDHVTTYARGMGGVRSSYLVAELAELAERHPPALEFLVGRRDELREQLEAGHISSDAFSDFLSLNWALGEQEASASTFEAMERHGHEDLEFIGSLHWEVWLELEAWDLLSRHPPRFARELSFVFMLVAQHELGDEDEDALERAQDKARMLLAALDGLGMYDMARTVRARVPRAVWDPDFGGQLAARLAQGTVDALELVSEPALMSELVLALVTHVPGSAEVLLAVNHDASPLAAALSMASGVPFAVMSPKGTRGAKVRGRSACLIAGLVAHDDELTAAMAGLEDAGARCLAVLCIAAPGDAEDAEVGGVAVHAAWRRGAGDE